jgi:hypothetical protein
MIRELITWIVCTALVSAGGLWVMREYGPTAAISVVGCSLSINGLALCVLCLVLLVKTLRME